MRAHTNTYITPYNIRTPVRYQFYLFFAFFLQILFLIHTQRPTSANITTLQIMRSCSNSYTHRKALQHFIFKHKCTIQCLVSLNFAIMERKKVRRKKAIIQYVYVCECAEPFKVSQTHTVNESLLFLSDVCVCTVQRVESHESAPNRYVRACIQTRL